MAVDDLANAGITAKERLERIELMLGRIDEKLDGKANQGDLVALEVRVRSIEQLGIDRVSDRVEKLTGGIEGIKTRMWMAVGGLAVLVIFINLFAAHIIHF